MQQSPGFIQHNQSHLVHKLHKTLYDFKQAPSAWLEKLSATLYSFWIYLYKVRSISIHSTYILVYVDDILITGSSEKVMIYLITN